MTCKINIKKEDGKFVEKLIKKVRFATKLTINKIYKGTLLVWSFISSCFGSGFWVLSSKWSDTEIWKN